MRLETSVRRRHHAKLHHHAGDIGMGAEFDDLAVADAGKIVAMPGDLLAGRRDGLAVHVHGAGIDPFEFDLGGKGVVTQNLLPTADGRARVPACEILIPDDAIRNLIRQGKIEQVYSVMQTGSQKGMQTMEQSLVDLVIRGYVTQEMALSRSSRPAQLLELIQRGRGPGTTVSPLQARLRTAGS